MTGASATEWGPKKYKIWCVEHLGHADKKVQNLIQWLSYSLRGTGSGQQWLVVGETESDNTHIAIKTIFLIITRAAWCESNSWTVITNRTILIIMKTNILILITAARCEGNGWTVHPSEEWEESRPSTC